MADEEQQLNDPEELDPSKRAADDISDASDKVSNVEGVIVVDEKLQEVQADRAAEEAHAARAAEIATVATEERAAAPVVEYTSSRNQARLLVITTDVTVHEDSSGARTWLLDLERIFAEVHVIVLSTTALPSGETERISDAVWLYPVYSRFWWKMSFNAVRVARKELSFGDGFRPDIVIADDPFESGLAGRKIARIYKRSFQVHVRDDYFDTAFKKKNKQNKWRVRIAHRVMKQVTCVRTSSEYLRKRVVERYKLREAQVEVLPVYYDMPAWKQSAISVDVQEKYPQFKFTLLHISTMNPLSYTAAVIDGLYYILRQYSTIGLVIVGDGPDKTELEKRVAGYGLQDRIIFESAKDVDTLSYIKTSQVVIHTSEETTQDKIILQAAAAEVPIVCGNYGLASQLFIDEESVLMCPVDSPPCFGEKVNRLLNDNRLRHVLTMNARSEVEDRIEQDYSTYMNAYRSSIERCLVSLSEEKASTAAESAVE